MTIYAIVNDFLTASSDGSPVWTAMSAASILQGGNPYFVPDFAERFEARAALAVRIGKLGKGIAPRFASRYAEAVAPAAVFVAADMLDRLRLNGLPWTAAISYDRSLAIGGFSRMKYEDIAGCSCSVTLTSAMPTEEASCIIENAGAGLEEALEAISRDNTLKTGDVVLLGLRGEGPTATPGQKATLKINGEAALRFNIR